MADLTFVPANIEILSKKVNLSVLQIGEAVTVIQPLRRLSTDNKYYLAQCDNDEDSAAVEYLSLTKAAANGFVIAIKEGLINPGVAVTETEQYVVSANSGKVMPIGDLASTNYRSDLFSGISTSSVEVKINATGAQK